MTLIPMNTVSQRGGEIKETIASAPFHVDNVVLAANVAKTVTIPAGAGAVIFSGTKSFFVNWGTTAAVPTEDITNGSGQELDPGAREIEGRTSFSVIAGEACILSLSFYS